MVGLVTYWGTCVCSRGCEVIEFFSHSSPGLTVPSSGIRRAKQDLLYPMYLLSQHSRRYGALFGHSASQAGLALPNVPSVAAFPALRCPLRAFGEPSWTCSTQCAFCYSSPGVTVSSLGIWRAKLEFLYLACRRQRRALTVGGSGRLPTIVNR